MENIEFNKNTGVEKTKQSSLWKKVKKISEVAVMSTLLSITGVETGLAQDKNLSPEEVKDKIEKIKIEIAKEEQKVIQEVEKKGINFLSGGMEKTKELKDPIKGLAIVGYDKYGQDKKAKWVYLETADAVFRFLDRDNNGSVDRVMLDKTTKQKSQTSDKFGKARVEAAHAQDMVSMLEPFNDLAKEKEDIASLEPEDKTVFGFAQGNKGENSIVRSVDFKTGEISELSGDEADALTIKMQQRYLHVLEDFVQGTQGK